MLDQAPQNLNAHLQLARAFVAVGRSTMAAPLLKAVEDRSPAGVGPWEQIGDLYASIGDFDGARRAYTRRHWKQRGLSRSRRCSDPREEGGLPAGCRG